MVNDNASSAISWCIENKNDNKYNILLFDLYKYQFYCYLAKNEQKESLQYCQKFIKTHFCKLPSEAQLSLLPELKKTIINIVKSTAYVQNQKQTFLPTLIEGFTSLYCNAMNLSRDDGIKIWYGKTFMCIVLKPVIVLYPNFTNYQN